MENSAGDEISVSYAMIIEDGLTFSAEGELKLDDLALSVNGQNFVVLSVSKIHTDIHRSIFTAKVDVEWAEHLGSRAYLEVRKDRYIADIPSNGLLAHLEAVSDCCVVGWVADLKAGSAVIGDISVNISGVPVPADRPYRIDLLGLFPSKATTGVRASLPAWCFDGLKHRITLEHNGTVLSHLNFCVDLQCCLEVDDSFQIQFWAFDKSQTDASMTVSISFTDGSTEKSELLEREDVFTALGRRFVGFSCIQNEKMVSSIRLGRESQILLFSWSRADTVEAVRASTATIARAGLPAVESLAARRVLVGLLRSPEMVGSRYQQANHSFLFRKVGIVIPVYLGLSEVGICFDALDTYLRNSTLLSKIVVVEDNTPDQAVRELCVTFASRYPMKVILVQNEKNRGFVESTNAGIGLLDTSCDVLLLNADAALSPNAIAKLRFIAHSKHDVASVTPMTNNGTMYSYPEVNAANKTNLSSARTIDALIEVMFRGATCDMPVGVGFCLYVRREALVEVGLLGSEWGKGYCEEVDWCLRARDMGFRHLAALDTFVWHEGSVSFGAAEREIILETNHKIIERKYPEYVSDIRAFMKNDPLEMFRIKLFAASREVRNGTVLHLCHMLGGGTTKYLDTLTVFGEQCGMRSLHMRIQKNDWLQVPMCVVHDRSTGEILRLSLSSVDAFLDEISKNGSLRVMVHSLLETSPKWLEKLASSGCEITVMCHDFQWYCPRVVLVDHADRYCGEPDAHFCTSCVRLNGAYDFGEGVDFNKIGVQQWRDRNEVLLSSVDHVLAPSEDTAKRIRAKFANLTVTVLAHPGSGVETTIRAADGRRDRVIRIGIVGALNVAKGAKFLLDFCLALENRQERMVVQLFGALSNEDEFKDIKRFKNMGRYNPSDLTVKLNEFRPDFILIPGVWPETYSYVLSEVWEAGYPVVALEIGAVAERVFSQGGGVLIDQNISPETLVDRIEEIVAAVSDLEGLKFTVDQKWVATEYMRKIFPGKRHRSQISAATL